MGVIWMIVGSKLRFQYNEEAIIEVTITGNQLIILFFGE